MIIPASVAAYEGQIGQAAYSSSQGRSNWPHLTCSRKLARFGVRVLVIAPDLIETPMMASLSEEARERLALSVPFPARLGRPSEFSQVSDAHNREPFAQWGSYPS